MGRNQKDGKLLKAEKYDLKSLLVSKPQCQDNPHVAKKKKNDLINSFSRYNKIIIASIKHFWF